jgi:hypothetical protein
MGLIRNRRLQHRMRKNPKSRRKESMIELFSKFWRKFPFGELNAKNPKSLINKQLKKSILLKKLSMIITH